MKNVDLLQFELDCVVKELEKVSDEWKSRVNVKNFSAELKDYINIECGVFRLYLKKSLKI